MKGKRNRERSSTDAAYGDNEVYQLLGCIYDAVFTATVDFGFGEAPV